MLALRLRPACCVCVCVVSAFTLLPVSCIHAFAPMFNFQVNICSAVLMLACRMRLHLYCTHMT